MIIIFCLTLFISASLIFIIEPMFGKMVLPLLGGTPAAWNTCLVFFQAALLAGYAYAHIATSKFRLSRQVIIHLVLMLLALICLPISIAKGWTPPCEGNPSIWLLMLLTVSVGLPFFIISASAPILQKWFSMTRHSAASDPYFLYAASNFGSIVGLVGYAVVLEPHLTLALQSRFWTWGYVLLGLLISSCAVVALRSKQKIEPTTRSIKSTEHLSWMRCLKWITLAFIPSSLMVSVTTYLTTDIASVPLLWMAPLMLYLVSFMLVFTRRVLIPHRYFAFILPLLVLTQMVALTGFPVAGSLWPLALHLFTFFVAAMACHGELASDRPSTEHLTEFYLLMSLGGVIGGIFSDLLAPVIFRSILEYPLVLTFACMLASWSVFKGQWKIKMLDVALPILLLLVAFFFIRNGKQFSIQPAIITSLAAVLCCCLIKRPIRFGLALIMLVLFFESASSGSNKIIYTERTFFGVFRVKRDITGTIHEFIHGTTIHGSQCLLPDQREKPRSYYTEKGPVGDFFNAFREMHREMNAGIIGLGTGTIACYALPGDDFTFYEIDPAINRLARNTQYFTFLSDADNRGAYTRIISGDARLTLREAEPKSYDLIVLDAFSSDSIPIHLLTREAMGMYLSKLRNHGVILANISNRHLDLAPELTALAADAGLVCRFHSDKQITEEETLQGKTESFWAVLAQSEDDMGKLAQNSDWQSMNKRDAVWTDDFSNILSVLKW